MAPATQPPDQYFESIPSVPSNPQWKCLVCKRQMGTYGAHSRSKAHLEAVARYEARLAAENQMIPGLNDNHQQSRNTTPSPPHQEDVFGDDEAVFDTEIRPPSPPLSYLRAFEFAQENKSSDSEDSDREIDLHKLAEAIAAMEDADMGPHDEAADEAALEADLRSGQLPDSSEWYPFKKKEDQLETFYPGPNTTVYAPSWTYAMCDCRSGVLYVP
ncbi:uncharacterized protein MELLADRAFT_93983 [Melampsora larici-populina 98AG31]|uniref:Uncharacterized protein n=1 Tax=Melampsora larici-populina (strain 98AG31 / pathotype 3-4-7) TaxID=747676 RepID=F4S5Z7_MELLP|nr:uncharacterized protein MELLADRAFT_93983 [Melampsora larici-populina 98AG31]EGF99930.1 hypothetical protein MELLADRAFT_93983 [Melampsora larici-populina 98AG31]